MLDKWEEMSVAEEAPAKDKWEEMSVVEETPTEEVKTPTPPPSINIPMFGNVTPQQMGTPAPPVVEEMQGMPSANIPMFGNVTPQQMATAPPMPSTFQGQTNAVEEVKPAENKGIFEQGVSKFEDALKIVPQIETDVKALNEAPNLYEAGSYYNKRRKELVDEYKNEINKDIVKKSTIDKDKVGVNTFLNLAMSGLGISNDEEEKVYSNSDKVKERLDKFDAEAKKVLNKRKGELSTLTDYDTDNLEGLVKTPDRADHQAINDYLDVIAATDPLKATAKSKSITDNSLPARDKYNITMQGYDMALQKLDDQFQPLYDEQQKLENSEALKTSMALQKEYKPLYDEQQKLANSDVVKNGMQLPQEQALQIPEVKKYIDLTNELNSKVQKINQLIQTPEAKRYAQLSNELNNKGKQFKNLQTLREGVSKRYNYEPPKEGDEGIWGKIHTVLPIPGVDMAAKQVARTAGGLGKTILTLGSLPQAYISGNEDNLRRTNDMLVSYDDALDQYVPILKDERIKQQDGSMVYSPKALYGEMLNGVGQLVEFAAPGMAFEKAALTLGGAAIKGTGSMALASLGEAAKPTVETIANYAGIMSSTMDDYTQEGFEKGLRGKELAAYATSHSLVEAATESFLSPESILKGAIKGFTKLGSEGVAKAIAGGATKQALKQGVKEGIKTIAGETGEEVTSAVLHNMLNTNVFNVNNDQDLKQDIQDALIVTPISMIPMALMGSVPRTHLTKIQSIYQAGQDPQHYKDIAEKMLASGKFTPQQANSVITTANAMSEIIKANPTLKQMNEWDAPQRAYAIYANQLLNEQLKNKNLLPETVEEIKGKIKDNDAIISGAVKMSKELGYERPIDKLPQAEQKVAISLHNELQRMLAKYQGKVDESKPLADQISPEDMKRVDEIHNQLMSLKNKYFKPTIPIDNSANEPATTGANKPFELDLNIPTTPTTTTTTEAQPTKKPSLSESILGELEQTETPPAPPSQAETAPQPEIKPIEIVNTPTTNNVTESTGEAKKVIDEMPEPVQQIFSLLDNPQEIPQEQHNSLVQSAMQWIKESRDRINQSSDTKEEKERVKGMLYDFQNDVKNFDFENKKKQPKVETPIEAPTTETPVAETPVEEKPQAEAPVSEAPKSSNVEEEDVKYNTLVEKIPISQVIDGENSHEVMTTKEIAAILGMSTNDAYKYLMSLGQDKAYKYGYKVKGGWQDIEAESNPKAQSVGWVIYSKKLSPTEQAKTKAKSPAETTTETTGQTLADDLAEANSLPRKAQIKKAINKLIDKNFENIFAQMTLKEPNKYKRIC
jgi:hypothetical protein